MGTPTIIQGEEYFNTVIYEGNGGGQRVGRFVPFTANPSIANSVIFNTGDSAKLERTPSSNGSGTTFTISLWYKPGKLGTQYSLFDNAPGGSAINIFSIIYNSDNTILIHGFDSSGNFTLNLATNRTFEDTSKFYHILVAVDTTQGTSSNRVKLYVDGTQITSLSSTTYPGSSATYGTNQTSVKQAVGYYPHNSSRYLDGYIAEFNLVDGTALTPSTFGQTDTSTGRWIPKTITGVTYGTNGVRLTFADSSAFGDDTSGNGNDMTATNLASTDQTTDSPTQNFTTLNTLRKGPNITLSEGNLKSTYSGGSQSYGIASQKGVNSGKFYAECTVNTRGSQLMFVCVWSEDQYLSVVGNDNPVFKNGGVGYRDDTGNVDREDAINQTYGATYTSGDIIGIALDANTGTVWFSKNGTWQNSATASEIAAGTTTNSAVTGLNGSNYNKPSGNFILGTVSHSGHVSTWNFGQKSFSYTPPTGFVALKQDNFPATDKGISSLVWAKNRDNGNRGHQLYDSSRGPLLTLYSNGNNAESTNADSLQKFLRGGFSAEDFTGLNEASESHVAWNWVANKGTTASNTEGSNTSTVQANTTAGFSIVEFTTPSGGTTITYGHGLTQAPEWFFFKNKGATGDWLLFHKSAYDASNGGYSMVLNSDAANAAFNTEFGATAIYPEAPTATTFALRNNSATAGSANYIAYCWHGVDGFSKFSSYSGNGNANGPFIQTNFKPAWLMIKRIDSAGYHWCILDNRRNIFNPANNVLKANLSAAEDDDANMAIDLLSNGFKIRGAGSDGDNINASGGTYIYMAFAENPFIGDGVSPVTAR